jgi:hypothetical protein
LIRELIFTADAVNIVRKLFHWQYSAIWGVCLIFREIFERDYIFWQSDSIVKDKKLRTEQLLTQQQIDKITCLCLKSPFVPKAMEL